MAARQERAEVTRRTIIDATVQALDEVGYDGTSTSEVCRRAGVARGTMLHHFPSKKALVLATLDAVLKRRTEEFREQLSEANISDLGGMVWHLWRTMRTGPTFHAWLELAVASRTDPELEGEFRAVMERFDRLVRAFVKYMMPKELRFGVDPEEAVFMILAALNGLAVSLLQHDEAAVEGRVEMIAQWASRFDPSKAR